MSPSNADQAPRPPKVDNRLIGVWKSDGKRTVKEWRWAKPISAKRKQSFRKIFGKLEVTYGRRRVHMRLKDWETSQRYLLLAADETSVAIVAYGELKIRKQKKHSLVMLADFLEQASKPTIQHIQFDKSGYWISIGGNREFFKRVKRLAS